MKKAGRNPFDVLSEIRAFIGSEAELHAQVISKDAQGMIKEAYKMREILGGKERKNDIDFLLDSS